MKRGLFFQSARRPFIKMWNGHLGFCKLGLQLSKTPPGSGTLILDDEEDVEGLEDIIGDLAENNIPVDRGLSFEELTTATRAIENSGTHYSLRGDLIEHLWSLKGSAFA
jgi:hypothetical protein